ncbi:MAG: NAD kinase [Chitinophagaceae bacterium]
MKVAIYSRGLDEEIEQHLKALMQELKLQKVECLIYEPLVTKTFERNTKSFQYTTYTNTSGLDDSIDCIISLGGDGTMLDTVTLVRDKEIPLLGINFGRLGFLASIGKNELHHAVESLVSHTYHIDQRTLIHLDSNVPLFNGSPFGLNEFVIHKKDTSPMIKVHTYMNGEFLNTYWADGLIVSTPTGSTGYNLSCNGPIVFPESGSFVITPVAPHNLNVRPLVVPDHNIISFEIEGRMDQFLCSLDSRREIVEKDVQLAVRKESFTLGLIRLNENTFLETLRNKLAWGLDKRN